MKRVAAALAVLAGAVGLLSLRARREQSYGDEKSETIDIVVAGRRAAFSSRAECFAGGNVLVAGGRLVLDLRGARLAPTGAYLEIDAWLGSVTVLAPLGVTVAVDGGRWPAGRLVTEVGGKGGGPPVFTIDARARGACVTVRQEDPKSGFFDSLAVR